MKFGEHLVLGLAKNFGCEVTDADMANMTFGFDIGISFGLYTKDSREQKKGKRRRKKDDDKDYKRRRRNQSNMGIRVSRDSSLNASTTSGFKGIKESRGGHRSRDDHLSVSR